MLGPKPCLKGHVATCTIAQASEPPPRSPGLLATGQLQALGIRPCSTHPGGSGMPQLLVSPHASPAQAGRILHTGKSLV